ncbi:curli-like amyloid fiber formation chaperone CsgH [Parasphingorhabdus sp.]|uniref:curli-like amyloid fiber formation chaperone CsgH n=1 Tax=Parasphingorhabdus sp. TaxID=2709688 RepID=UPI0030038E69
MTDLPVDRALRLEVTDNEDGLIQVRLSALSPESQKVSYEIVTQGASRSSHRGNTTLAANEPATLSTISFSYADNWCVKLNAVEESGKSYDLQEGPGCG